MRPIDILTSYEFSFERISIIVINWSVDSQWSAARCVVDSFKLEFPIWRVLIERFTTTPCYLCDEETFIFVINESQRKF